MSDRKRGIPEKETICWNCKNYSRCSWANGIPVKGWKATPTKIENIIGGYLYITDSFLVEACPQFKADDKRIASMKELAGIVGISERYIYTFIYNKGYGALINKLKEKGYKLTVYKIDKKHRCYLEKI